MTEEKKSFEVDDDELENAVGGLKARKAPGEPTEPGARTRRAGGQWGGEIRPAGDVEIGEA